jgi:hypothetical protein
MKRNDWFEFLYGISDYKNNHWIYKLSHRFTAPTVFRSKLFLFIWQGSSELTTKLQKKYISALRWKFKILMPWFLISKTTKKTLLRTATKSPFVFPNWKKSYLDVKTKWMCVQLQSYCIIFRLENKLGVDQDRFSPKVLTFKKMFILTPLPRCRVIGLWGSGAPSSEVTSPNFGDASVAKTPLFGLDFLYRF